MAQPFSRLVAVLTPRRRRAQFSLRALLGLTAFICILLGGWHLLETYGQRIEVNDVVVGGPIKVKVRYVRVFGPPVCNVRVNVSDEDYDNPSGHYQGAREKGRRRSWLCFYTYECEFEPVTRPCELYIQLGEFVPRPSRSIKRLFGLKIVKRKTVVVK